MGSSGGGSSDTTIHYDQSVVDNYKQLGWYVFNFGESVDTPENEKGAFLQDQLSLTPFNVLESFNVSILQDYNDSWNNYFIPMLRNFDPDWVGIGFSDVNINNFQRKFINGVAVIEAVAAQNIYLDDDINQNVLPKLRTTLRDIGSVMSSSFIDSQAMVQMNKTKVLSKFKSDLNIKELEISQNAWTHYLDWRWKVQDFNIKFLESFYKTGMSYNDQLNKVTLENLMWHWTVIDNVRATVGALNGAPVSSKSSSFNPSAMQQAATYVGMAGALVGMYNGLSNLGGPAVETMTGAGGGPVEAGWMGAAGGVGAASETGLTIDEIVTAGEMLGMALA